MKKLKKLKIADPPFQFQRRRPEEFEFPASTSVFLTLGAPRVRKTLVWAGNSGTGSGSGFSLSLRPEPGPKPEAPPGCLIN